MTASGTKYEGLFAKLTHADRLEASQKMRAGSISAWFEQILDAFICNDQKDRRNARDRARRARQRKGGMR